MKNEVKKAVSIILVEDDHALSRVWKTLFEMLGYQVSSYQTASDCLAQRKQAATFDVIITDYYLPDLNGVELIKEIRQDAPMLPAIVLTGSHESFIREAVKQISNSCILYKPLNVADIEAKLEEILGRS